MKTEIVTLKIFNSFSGRYEELICSMDLHFLKTKLVAASLTKVISNEGDDILEWLNNDKLEDMETDFVEAYNG